MRASLARLRALAVVGSALVWASPGCGRPEAAPGGGPPGPDVTSPAWETLDRFMFDGTVPTMASRIVVDGQGNYFTSCYVGATVYTRWLVRKSSDGGRTWVDADSFQSGAGRWNYPTGIATDDDGNLFVSGVIEDAAGIEGQVRRSTDHGATRTASQHDPRPGSAGSKTYDVRSLGGGLVFAMGRHAQGVLHWPMRRSTDRGATWTDVDDPHPTQPYVSKVFDVARAPNGDLVAFGFQDSAEKEAWLFRKSSDDGRTWTDLSRHHTQPGFTDVVGGLLATTGGVLIAAGWTIDPKGPIRRLLRRSTDSGSKWITFDDYQLDRGRTPYQGLAEDSRGRLFAWATQAAPEAAGTRATRGMIRVSDDVGGTWRDFLGLHGVDAAGATYTSLFIDPSDQLLVSGRDGSHAVVLRTRLAPRGSGVR